MKKTIIIITCLIQTLAIYATSGSWENYCDTTWYDNNPNATTFYISNGAELAGLAYITNRTIIFQETPLYWIPILTSQSTIGDQ